MTNLTAQTIRRISVVDTLPAMRVLFEACDDDLLDWLLPVTADRPTQIANAFYLAVVASLKTGHAYTTIDGQAVALWLTEVEHQHDIHPGAADLDPTSRAAIAAATIEAYHPAYPHHHLAWLAVHPDVRGTGYGATLMSHHELLLDAAGVPGYTVATSTVTRDFLDHRGWQVAAEFELNAGADRPAWAMTRSPRHTLLPQRQLTAG